jgi:hypothetical protein
MKKGQLSIVNGQWFAFKSTKKFFLLLMFYFFLLHISAQSVSASLDRDKILLGEQVTLQFSLNNINEDSSFLTSWPQLSDTIEHTEVLKRTAIDTINVNGANTYQQNFTLTSFDSGRWQLGPFIFVIQNKVSGKQIRLITAPIYLTVLPVDVSSLQDYHPIKDIIDVETSFNWIPVAIGAAIVLLAIIILITIKRRKKKIAAPAKIVLKGTPLERVIEKLSALEKEPLITITAIKKFHSDIDIITRQYFEEVMQIKALQLTSTELSSRINVYMQDLHLRSKFQQVFELNNSVKFAKYMPGEEESKHTLKEIITGLQQIDESVHYIRDHADTMVSKY